jgi:hypothetical protein
MIKEIMKVIKKTITWGVTEASWWIKLTLESPRQALVY